MAISCSFSWGSFPGSAGNVRVISWADGRAVFSPGVADVDSASAAADVSADGGGTMATFSCAKSGT